MQNSNLWIEYEGSMIFMNNNQLLTEHLVLAIELFYMLLR